MYSVWNHLIFWNGKWIAVEQKRLKKHCIIHWKCSEKINDKEKWIAVMFEACVCLCVWVRLGDAIFYSSGLNRRQQEIRLDQIWLILHKRHCFWLCCSEWEMANYWQTKSVTDEHDCADKNKSATANNRINTYIKSEYFGFNKTKWLTEENMFAVRNNFGRS